MRIARQFQWWNPASATLETPLQKLPFRVMAVAWSQVAASTNLASYALAEIIDGSGIVIWQSRGWCQTSNAVAVAICFGVNQPGGYTDGIFPANSAAGHLPPDLWVMPNERLRISFWESGAVVTPGGTTAMFSLAFPDEPESPARRRTMDRGTDGKPTPKKRRKKRK